MNDYNPFNLIATKRKNTTMYDFKDKDFCRDYYVTYMLNRTQSMFIYENLPDTIPQRNLEMLLQVNGFALITKADDGNLYAFFGGLGGMPNEYYLPTICTVANPFLKFNKECKINVDSVLMWNDSNLLGIIPLCDRYATLLTENDITLRKALINLRATNLISAPDDTTKKSAEIYQKKLESGDDCIIAESQFLDGIRVQPMLSAVGNNYLTQIIEAEQYIKASWFNELGLNCNYNMKREALNSSESELNKDLLIPLVQDMLNRREIGVKQINEMFNTNITVRLASVWLDKIEDEEIKQEENSKRLENEEQTTINEESEDNEDVPNNISTGSSEIV